MDKLFCPKCGDEIKLYGSDCYPNYDINSEHENNEDCTFDIKLKINHIIPNGKSMIKAVEMVMRYIYG